ncbi:MAG: type II toxin-antitoxin system RelB/DinJ family antitoxin [bacterium]|nr:type II toxin-antitoxin system RelB/DinJ family antitoxin [bacterium]
MVKTEMIRARVEPELKREAEEVLGELGMSATEAITMFYTQVAMQRGLPFDVKLPNAETTEALHQARRMAVQSMNCLPVDPIERYLHEQRSGIVRVFNEQQDFFDVGPIAFSSWSEMKRQIELRDTDRRLTGSEFSQVGRRSLDNVRSYYDARWGEWQCWVRAGYRDYRRAFLAWLVARGFVVDSQAIAGYDVDHLFSAARAPSSDHVIRLVLVSREVNRSWGGWAEKLDAGRVTRTRNDARYFHIAKAVGIAAPDSIPERLARPDGFQEFVAALVDAGVKEIPGSQMSEDIAKMFQAIDRQAMVVANLPAFSGG